VLLFFSVVLEHDRWVCRMRGQFLDILLVACPLDMYVVAEQRFILVVFLPLGRVQFDDRAEERVKPIAPLDLES